nr:uncharacterized protein LOC111419242 [Onthophagus taurus]
MIFPLIESCVPQDLLSVWQRSSHEESATSTQAVTGLEKRLASLMSFLKNEVENDQRTRLAAEGFGLRPTAQDRISTAAGLINHGAEKCVFCGNTHESANCFKAQKLTLEKKKEILSGKKACFKCLRIGHQSRQCKARLRCLVCSQSHVILMCPDLPKENRVIEKSKSAKGDKTHDVTVNETLTCTNSTNTHVFLQTLRVKLCGVGGSRNVRALIDTGSQNTYILKSTALALGYQSKRREKIIHCLFGGATSQENHECYEVTAMYKNYKCSFEALSQSVICTDIAPVFDGPWMQELDRMGIHVTDKYDPAPIELLIGSDVAGRLYTGKRHILSSGLVAVETLYGWTLMGRIPLNTSRSATMTSISLFVRDASITRLWQLDVLGITDPTEHKSRQEVVSAARDFFNETVKINEDGRYEVNLPWLEAHPPLPDNYAMARRRLDKTVHKLEVNGLLESYDNIFQEWLSEGIIEEVLEDSRTNVAHYLPHRPVVKEDSATTKIRPVFDASAKEKNGPSLNQCLETGPNLIELIPNMLHRFRQNKIGVTADIRKAFLQIGVDKGDRDFLRFLWRGPGDEIRTYRHKRVVFGVSSSPFLLGATLEHHISKSLDRCDGGNLPYSRDTVSRLSRSFYVDNCIASVQTEQILRCFIEESSMIMEEARFDLRGWEFSRQICSPDYKHTPLLGLEWDKRLDTLKLNTDFLKDLEKLLQEPITKRVMLSLAQRVFDPIGFTCPATLLPKLMLQKTWEKKIGWDVSVDLEIEETFRNWVKELNDLRTIEIPRWVRSGPGEAEQLSVHTFCDASQNAYAAVIFLRGVYEGKVFIRLLAAKSRISPLKKITIPRLELLAAVVGARLYGSVRDGLAVEADNYFWSDSTTVISWIHRNEDWGTFVHNRVAEIRRTTHSDKWRFVPGILNPADLPSRGCGVKFLLHSGWWEGPRWLYGDPKSWPEHEGMQYDELEINREKKKKITSSLLNTGDHMNEDELHLTYFSKYLKTRRMIAWILRFIFNTRNPINKRKGALTEEEIGKAETFVVKRVQRDSLDENDKRWRNLQSFRDENGVIRVKSRVLIRWTTSARLHRRRETSKVTMGKNWCARLCGKVRECVKAENPQRKLLLRVVVA